MGRDTSPPMGQVRRTTTCPMLMPSSGLVGTTRCPGRKAARGLSRAPALATGCVRRPKSPSGATLLGPRCVPPLAGLRQENGGSDTAGLHRWQEECHPLRSWARIRWLALKLSPSGISQTVENPLRASLPRVLRYSSSSLGDGSLAAGAINFESLCVRAITSSTPLRSRRSIL